jgi:hypothetical protein
MENNIIIAIFVGIVSFVLLIWMVVQLIKNMIYNANPNNAPLKICQNCGNTAKVWAKVRGSFYIEIILWLFFLIPGLIYSIWRLGGKVSKCTSCGSTNMIFVNSPKAKELMDDFDKVKCPYCAELIKSEAKICKHCKSDLNSFQEKDVDSNVEINKNGKREYLV